MKKSTLALLVLMSSTYASSINEEVKNKELLQVSSCLDMTCILATQKDLEGYDYITTVNDKYYVTYIINVDPSKAENIRKKLFKSFPDMILRKKFPKEKTSKKKQQDNTPKVISSTFIEKYKRALRYFKKRNYVNSYNLLNELFEIKTNDININFYLGRSAYEIKKYDEAVSAYERFLFEKPDNNRVKLEMARSYYMTGSYKESKKLLVDVKKDPKIPKQTLGIVNYYLKLIDQKSTKHFVNGVMMLGVNYDSNINSRSNSDIYNSVYYPDFNVYLNDVNNTVEDSSAWYNQEIGLLNYKYKMSDNKIIKQDFMFFNKDSFQTKYNDTDVTFFNYTPALSVQHTQNLLVNYALYTDILWYGGKKTLQTVAAFPKFNYKFDANNSISGHVKYQRKFNKKSDSKSKDSIYTEASASFHYTFNKQLLLTSSVTLTKEKKNSGIDTSIDYNATKGGLSLNYKYKPNLIFAPSVSYTVSKYKDEYNHDYTQKQSNKQLKVSLSSTYIYSPKLIVQGNIDYTKQRSNDLRKEYNKHMFALNLIRPF